MAKTFRPVSESDLDKARKFLIESRDALYEGNDDLSDEKMDQALKALHGNTKLFTKLGNSL
jgi:hypothetical protein